MNPPGDSLLYYYEKDGERAGPETWVRLVELRESGEISDETLVWSNGMSDWVPLSDLLSSGDPMDPVVECAFSGVKRAQSRMLPFGDRWVAPEHKDEFVQELAEGGSQDEVVGAIEGYPFSPSLTVGSTLSQTWSIWKDQVLQIFLVTALVWVPLSIGIEYLNYEVFEGDPDSLDSISNSFRLERSAEFWIGTIVAGGVMMLALRRWNGEKKLSLSETFGEGLRNYGRLLGTRFLGGLILLGILFVAIFPVVLISGAAGDWMLLFFLPIGVAALWLMIRLGSADASALILQEGGMEAIKRSWRMTKGYVWKTVACRIVAYASIVLPILVSGFILAIPGFDNFLVSGLVSGFASCVLSFTVVFEMVLGIHLNEEYCSSTTDLRLPSL